MNQTSWDWTEKKTIASKLECGRDYVDWLVEKLRNYNWPESEVFGIRLALEEAVVNAMKHGNGLDPDKSVQLDCRMSSSRFWIQIEDEGTGFDPQDVPDCTAHENLDKASGRGLLLMKHYMSFVEYNERGNKVVMDKRLPI